MSAACHVTHTHLSLLYKQEQKKKIFLEARREMNEHTLISCEKRSTTDINQTRLSVWQIAEVIYL